MRRRQFIGAGLSLAAAWPFRSLAAVAKAGPLEARSLDGGELLLPRSLIEDFGAGLHGELLLADHPAYDDVRRLWNASFDRHPALIARCTGAADVVQAVNFAREQTLLTAVRAGGHSFSGKSSCDGGLMIDLQPMAGVRVDPAAQRAWLEGGSLLAELDRESLAFGLVTTTGTVSHTGAAGLTLGGGFGRLGRRFGLACDNVASFDVVTADGRFVRASASENADLYWGLRGGGGNFGVVTNFEYVLHPMNPVVLGGNIVWPITQAREVLRAFRDMAPGAPEAVNLEFVLFPGAEGQVVMIEACWSGDHRAGEAWLAPLRRIGKPVADNIAPMPYARLQQVFDDALSPGAWYYSTNGFLDALTDDGIDRVLDVQRRWPNEFVLFIDAIDGAYHRLAPDATAFPNRRSAFFLGCIAAWSSPEGVGEKIERIRAAWRELEPITAGFYTNLAAQDTSLARYRENYGANLERLVALKAKYDPGNLFRLNANVPPRI